MNNIEKEREMIKQAAIKAAQRMVQPRAAEIDATAEIPRDLVAAFGKQGFLSLLLPEQYGGMNGDLTTFCLVVEEIAKVCGSSSLLILAQGMGTLPIEVGGNASQKERFFSQIAEKNSLTAFALNERAGWMPASLQTKAEKKGKEYILNGQKSFVTLGGIAQFYSVFAVTHRGRGTEGITAFIVEEGTPGLRFGQKEEKIGMRGSVTADVILENCRTPERNRLGEEGEGWTIALKSLHRSRLAIGAQAVGLAQAAFDYAVQYASERIQFKKPIAHFQAIQFMMADMATQIEAARTLVYQTAARIDAQMEETEALSSMAKCYATDMAMKVTTDAVQILGGYGYMKDYPVERMMRDAKVTQIYEGANQYQLLDIAQHLLSRKT
ncbi:MAG: acyl-CoA dehydrogenase [Deltaproteobacteria bacterium RBG_16_50_11]|nr:MAG: acyl-CoA dehydrogenase [Deltaproteobacteria bacterium RBG_16_50_11]